MHVSDVLNCLCLVVGTFSKRIVAAGQVKYIKTAEISVVVAEKRWVYLVVETVHVASLLCIHYA